MQPEGDPLNVILPQQNSSTLPHWSIEHLIEDVRNSLKSFLAWFVNHICRKANYVAHNVARWALLCNSVWE